MGTHQDPIQGTVVLLLAVVGALLNRTFDALIGMAIHILTLLYFAGNPFSPGVMASMGKNV